MSWEASLPSLWQRVWDELEQGVCVAAHPARRPTFATISADGPALRTVVLRGIDRQSCTFEVHTDTASRKIAEVRTDPRVGAHVWLPEIALQIRLWAIAEVTEADPNRWSKIPPKSQIVYGGSPTPGTPISEPRDHTPGATIERFATLTCRVTRADIVHLGQDLHRRAVYEAPDWSGQWVAP